MYKISNLPTIRPTIKCSKQYKKLILKAEKELEKECSLQLDLVTCSAIIALNRYWNWNNNQITELLELHKTIWDECGSSNEISMIQLLDEECDIELTNQEGVSYKDSIYLNSELDDGRKLTPAQWLLMRQNQKKWVCAQITACICLAVHRKENWSFNRISELLIKMDDIKYEFDYNSNDISQYVYDNLNYNWLGYTIRNY